MMQYPLIDILRAVAVLLVMAYHVVGLGEWSIFSELWWGLPFRRGWIGVDLFLVISGFVITLSAVRERLRNPQGFRGQFMQRRLRRLLPLYFLTCSIFIFFVRPELLMRPVGQVAAIVGSHALFLQNLLPLTHGAINGVTWSLALEMQFYVALVLLIDQLLKLGTWRVLLLLVGVSWVWRYGIYLMFKSSQDAEQLMVIYTTQLPGMLDSFGVGIALALLLLKTQGRHSLSPGWAHCLRWALGGTVLLGLAGALLVTYDSYWAHTGMVVFFRTLLALGFGAALAAVVTCPLRGGGMLRPARYLGQISYGIYLWHFPMLLALLTLPGLRGTVLFVTLLVGTIVLASLSWHLMEKHWISVVRTQQ